MTPQEQQMLQDLVNRINQTVLQEKDPEAEQFLVQSLSRNPDAVYILSQTVLVQRYALDQAKKQLDDAKQAAQQAPPPAPVHHTSFLGSLLGQKDPAPPPPSQQYNQQQYQPVNYAPAPGYQQTQYAQQPQFVQPGYGAAPGGGGGFLRGALQTAGGVAAGALAFEGIESLMHGFGEHAGYGGGSAFGEMGGMGQPREEVINNYYGDDSRDRGGISPDIEDRRDDGGRDAFSGSSNDDYTTDDADTNAGTDDYGSDDSSSDDSGSDYGSDGN